MNLKEECEIDLYLPLDKIQILKSMCFLHNKEQTLYFSILRNL